MLGLLFWIKAYERHMAYPRTTFDKQKKDLYSNLETHPNCFLTKVISSGCLFSKICTIHKTLKALKHFSVLGKYQLLFLSKHTQNMYQNVLKLLVSKSTNNSFTRSPTKPFLLV